MSADLTPNSDLPDARQENLTFTSDELTLLARTADALTAYSGKSVLAEHGTFEDGGAWVIFAIPLSVEEKVEKGTTTVQMGGPGTLWLGNAGGLNPGPDDVYECRYIWSIQITDDEGARFVKLDENGEAAAWSDFLPDLLPFAAGADAQILPPDEDEDEGDR